MHFHVIPMFTKDLNQVPHLIDTVACLWLKPENSPIRGEVLRRMAQMLIEPSQNPAQLFPLVLAEQAGIKKRIRRRKHALRLMGVLIDSLNDKTQIA